MHLPLWLQSALRPFRIFRMSTQSRDYSEFPQGPTPVNTWESQLVDACGSKEDVHGRMDGHRVQKLALYKAGVRMKHESIVATIGGTQRDRRLQLERCVSPQQENQRDNVANGQAGSAAGKRATQISGGSPQDLSRLSSISSLSSSSGPDAYDTVMEIFGKPEGKLVKTVTFTQGHQPTLLQLAIAAATVHDDSPHYNIFKRQCYWFADMLLQVLARSYETVDNDALNIREDDQEEVRVPQGEDEEKFRRKMENGELCATASGAQGGKFMIMRIYRAKKKVIEKLAEDFNTRRGENEAKVAAAYEEKKRLERAASLLPAVEAQLHDAKTQLQRERERHQREQEALQREHRRERDALQQQLQEAKAGARDGRHYAM